MSDWVKLEVNKYPHSYIDNVYCWLYHHEWPVMLRRISCEAAFEVGLCGDIATHYMIADVPEPPKAEPVEVMND